MTDYDYDLFVVGAGSGGVRAANLAANQGARVAVAEVRHFGGTCVNLGCVPKKLLVYAAQFKDDFAAAAGFGWTLDNASFDWPSLIANKNREVERLRAVYQHHLQQSRVTIFNGKVQLLDAHTVAVAGAQSTAKRILLATGGWPFVPDIAGKEYIVTSNDMFSLDKLPERIVIVGGGYIAVEFASILNSLGVDTTICHREPKLLAGFDEDIRDFLATALRKQGIEILFDCDVQSIAAAGDAYNVRLLDGNTMVTDLVMYATGRTPNSRGFGLEQLGVALDDNGAIIVDSHYQTNLPSIYALGDVTDRVNLTPVAIAEGEALVNSLYAMQQRPVDYANIPTAVFCQPNIASVGLTEAKARQQYTDIDIYKTEFKPLKNTLSGKDENTLMKMVVDHATGKVIGLHMVGADAPEIIQGMAVAMRAGATKALFDSTIGIHPTAAEEFVTLQQVGT
ncbi:glutathione-disulfide reductase [Methylomonas koyamae]|uniref:glutathione-disulfide reductase n=1 Tax=Methylomonas koyamae TaxID=702114 RepID=UPI0011292932|nr:glutathione-disulfide reductase [Methylomonas koyamae]TPQ24302.1 glutathione-disulfide reductase [Methylomonas koyamae]